MAVDISHAEMNPDLRSNDDQLTTDPSTTTVAPMPSIADKIWPWALLGSCIFLVLLVLILWLVKRCCKRKPQHTASATEVELGKTILPQPYSLTPKRRDEIPLLEVEPRVHPKQSMPLVASFGEASDNSLQTNLNNSKKVSNKTDPLQLPPPQEIQPKRDPSMNNVNRESNTKIPFKNQLSSDTNSLRHIDSSSEDSFGLVVPPSTPVKPEISEDDQRAPNFHTNEANPLDEGVSIEEPDSQMNSSSSVDTETNGGPTSTDIKNREDKRPWEKVSMRKYYLKREASSPPKLPPKKKSIV